MGREMVWDFLTWIADPSPEPTGQEDGQLKGEQTGLAVAKASTPHDPQEAVRVGRPRLRPKSRT
jgi:hypothetical protein